MMTKRIIPCLDVRDGRLTKGIRFQENVDIGCPVRAARKYYEEGADEIVFYDIGASPAGRGIMLEVVSRVAREIFIPFAVGGGIRSEDDMRRVILAGAEKVSVNTEAFLNPDIIRQGAQAFGEQCIVLGMDVRQVPPREGIPSGYEVVIHGGRTPTGKDARDWACQAESLGAGEICLNSIDADGTREGYEINLTRLISESVRIPVIASGGAGQPEHLHEVLTRGKADAALVASIVHFSAFTIAALKDYLGQRQVPVRTDYAAARAAQ